MADQDQELKIKIIAEADNTGFKSAAEASEELTGATKKATEATEEQVKHFEGERQLLNELNRIVPGLGHALHAAFAGPLGPVILLGVAISEVQQKLKDYNDDLDQQGEAAAAGHVEAIHAIRDAWDSVKTKQAEYLAQLADAGKDKDPVATQIKRIKELEAAQLESDKKIIESLGKREEALIRASGGSEGDIEKARARTQAAMDSADNNAATNSVNDLLKVRMDALLKQAGLESAEAGAADAAGRTDARLRRATGERDSFRNPDMAAGFDKKITDASEALESAQYVLKYGTNQDDLAMVEAAKRKVEEAQAELGLLQHQKENSDKRLGQLEILVPQLEAENARALNELENAKAALTQNKNLIGTTPGEINHAVDLNRIKSGGSGAAAGFDVGAVAGVYEQIVSGRPITQSMRAIIAAQKGLLDSAHANTTEILQIILNDVGKQKELASIIADVKRQVSAMPGNGR